MIGIWFTESGRKVAPFLLVFFLFSFLAVCPGLFFRQHYFVQFLPAAALCAGAAVWALEKAAAKYTTKSKAVQFAILAAAVAFSLTGHFPRGVFLRRPPRTSSAVRFTAPIRFPNV